MTTFRGVQFVQRNRKIRETNNSPSLWNWELRHYSLRRGVKSLCYSQSRSEEIETGEASLERKGGAPPSTWQHTGLWISIHLRARDHECFFWLTSGAAIPWSDRTLLALTHRTANLADCNKSERGSSSCQLNYLYVLFYLSFFLEITSEYLQDSPPPPPPNSRRGSMNVRHRHWGHHPNEIFVLLLHLVPVLAHLNSS